jgi:hypothetical protein
MADTIKTAFDRIKRRYRHFADVECGNYGRLYSILAHSVVNDEELLSFIAKQPDQQPNLFLGAVHYLLGVERMPQSAGALREFIITHGEDVAQVMRSHHTQTNEIGRCAVILPALPKGPIGLIEVGASGGLCLFLDKFRYEYGKHCVGPANSPVVLRCTPKGAVPLPAEIPAVEWRQGLDIDPIDLNNDDQVRWLLALVWPDHVERRERLKAAIELCRAQPSPVMRGDLVDDLPALLEAAPKQVTLVVFHSAVFPYVDSERRQAFVNLLAEFSHKREIVWISNESPRAIPELDALAPQQSELRFLLGRTLLSGGRITRELLGLSQPHGWDLEWVAAGD